VDVGPQKPHKCAMPKPKPSADKHLSKRHKVYCDGDLMDALDNLAMINKIGKRRGISRSAIITNEIIKLLRKPENVARLRAAKVPIPARIFEK